MCVIAGIAVRVKVISSPQVPSYTPLFLFKAQRKGSRGNEWGKHAFVYRNARGSREKEGWKGKSSPLVNKGRMQSLKWRVFPFRTTLSFSLIWGLDLILTPLTAWMAAWITFKGLAYVFWHIMHSKWTFRDFLLCVCLELDYFLSLLELNIRSHFRAILWAFVHIHKSYLFSGLFMIASALSSEEHKNEFNQPRYSEIGCLQTFCIWPNESECKIRSHNNMLGLLWIFCI